MKTWIAIVEGPQDGRHYELVEASTISDAWEVATKAFGPFVIGIL